MNIGHAYWVHGDQGGRVYIPVSQGRKHIHCLTIEADGLHTARLSGRFKATEEDMTPRKVRGHVRKMKAATKGAAKLKKELLK